MAVRTAEQIKAAAAALLSDAAADESIDPSEVSALLADVVDSIPALAPAAGPAFRLQWERTVADHSGTSQVRIGSAAGHLIEDSAEATYLLEYTTPPGGHVSGSASIVVLGSSLRDQTASRQGFGWTDRQSYDQANFHCDASGKLFVSFTGLSSSEKIPSFTVRVYKAAPPARRDAALQPVLDAFRDGLYKGPARDSYRFATSERRRLLSGAERRLASGLAYEREASATIAADFYVYLQCPTAARDSAAERDSSIVVYDRVSRQVYHSVPLRAPRSGSPGAPQGPRPWQTAETVLAPLGTLGAHTYWEFPFHRLSDLSGRHVGIYFGQFVDLYAGARNRRRIEALEGS